MCKFADVVRAAGYAGVPLPVGLPAGPETECHWNCCLVAGSVCTYLRYLSSTAEREFPRYPGHWHDFIRSIFQIHRSVLSDQLPLTTGLTQPLRPVFVERPLGLSGKATAGSV